MSCGFCKQLACGCVNCSNGRNINEIKQISIANPKTKEPTVMCPICGTTYDFETNAWLVNDYSYASHVFFEELKSSVFTSVLTEQLSSE